MSDPGVGRPDRGRQLPLPSGSTQAAQPSRRRSRGAAGWSYALTLGFALVYLGEHYVVDVAAGAALVGTVRLLERYAEPVAAILSEGIQRLERVANG